MPRVALFTTQFLPYSQTFIYNEILNHDRYEVEVFSRIRRNEDYFPYDPVHAQIPAEGLLNKLEAKLYSITTISRHFTKKIRTGEFDLIHAHFGTGSVYALRYQRLSGLPLVVTFHGYDVPLLMTSRRFCPRHWRYWLASRKMFKRTTLFLAASEELAHLLIKLGAPEERVRIWRLGIPLPEMPDDRNRHGNSLLMIGRFVEKKGFEYGIRAFARLLGKMPELHLYLAGSGPLEKKLKKIVNTLGITDSVSFLGVLDGNGIKRVLTEVDLVLAPSVTASNGDRESGLIVAKEAAASGLPVVGTMHGGIPEIIDDGRTGFLVPERDHLALAEKCEILMKNENLRTSMGQNARMKMEKEYDIKNRVRALEEIYDSVLKKPL